MIRRWPGRRPGRCPDDGALRARLDTDALDAELDRHVSRCARCAARLERLRADARWAGEALRGAAPAAPPDVRRAWQRLGARMLTTEEGPSMEPTPAPWNRGGFRLATALVALLAVVGIFTFTPMRTVADGVLERFRVQKFAVVTIPMDLVAPFESAFLENLDAADAATWQERFEDLGTFATTFTPNSARQVASIEEARATHGDFAVPDVDALPDGFGATPEVFVTDAGTASYALNTAEAQAIIDQLNLPIYSLPDADRYPTLTFTFEAPAGVGLVYSGPNGAKLVVAEMGSPTITFPDGLDMNALREEILRFPGLPADIVAQLRAIDDWEHTLIIPVPEGANSRDVTVNGEPGLLIEDAGNGSVVLWEDDGILHLVAGQVDDEALLDVANSLD